MDSGGWVNARLYLPAYRFADVARLAETTPQSVRRWFRGYDAPGHHMDPVLPAPDASVISYLQLVETAFVASFRRQGVDLSRLRQAHEYLRSTFRVDYPLAQWRFKVHGQSLLVEIEGDLIAADRGGQYAVRQIIEERAEQFDYDDVGVALRWHPRGRSSVVLVDPRIAFGAPVVKGVPTRVLKDRYAAGEDVSTIADDYEIERTAVVEALEFEGVALQAVA